MDWFRGFCNWLTTVVVPGIFGRPTAACQVPWSLRDLLSVQDDATKRAVLINISPRLADLLGLRNARRLALISPDFTPRNLALLSDSCDFLVSEHVLNRDESFSDIGSEALRVLKAGGWFVQVLRISSSTDGFGREDQHPKPPYLIPLLPYCEELNTCIGSPVAEDTTDRAAANAALPVKVPPGDNTTTPTNPAPDRPFSIWIYGRKAVGAPEITATVGTRVASPVSYVFKPRASKLGVVSCARNEAPYLVEWIAHYRVLGFEQITIYDNESNDASAAILRPLSNAGLINAVFWRPPPGQSKQVSAYNDARRRLRKLIDWCLFVDLDEYLVLNPGITLRDVLPPDAAVSAIGIPWRIFGSAGKRYREPGITLERFQKAARTNDHHIKSLVRLRDVEFMNIHVPRVRDGCRIVDLEGREVPYGSRGKLDWIVDGPARINHYFCRSYEEFECKRSRGRGAVSADQADALRPPEIFHSMDQNEIDLSDGSRLLPAIKREMAHLRRVIQRFS